MLARSFKFAALLLASLVCAGQAQALPLLINGGFETGDFSGWTQGPASAIYEVATDVQRSGEYAAVFGEVGASVQLSQLLATEAGRSYELVFWMWNAGGGSIGNDATITSFEVMLNGASLLSVSDKADNGYQQYKLDFTADSAASELVFQFRHDEIFWALDDVSVTQIDDGDSGSVPEPSTLLLLGASLLAFRLQRRA